MKLTKIAEDVWVDATKVKSIYIDTTDDESNDDRKLMICTGDAEDLHIATYETEAQAITAAEQVVRTLQYA